MRKLLLFIALIFISTSVFATGRVAKWRWRNNNGTEATATWKAAEGSAITISNNQSIRLRLNFLNTDPILPTLTYSRSIGGPYVPIKDDNAGTRDAFVLAGNNANISHWQPTTRQMADTSFDYYTGRIITQEDTTRTFAPDVIQGTTEFEWAIKPTKYVKPGITYYFKSSGARGMVTGGAFIEPSLNTSNDIPHEANTDDALRGFNLFSQGKNLTLEFRTRFDGHDHFDIQYSEDRTNWHTIKTIPGGNQHDYQTTLPNPPAGITIVYARIKLYDREGGVVTSNPVRQEFRSNADITTFAGIKEGMKVKFNLGVSSEYINPGFKIGRTNASNTTFTPIVSIPGRGTSNVAKNWEVFDNTPIMGTNRYVLQYYKNGVISYKLIEVKVGLGADAGITKRDVEFNIYPNPSNSGKVSFDLKGYKGKTFTAKLTNLYGKQIGSETFTVNNNGNYVLKAIASSGTYVLNVSGEGITKTGKVLVQ